jgi:hypothetical protein
MKNKNFKKSPFGEDKLWQFNACVGQNGGPYDYLAYSHGYFQAGHLICEELIKNGGIGIDTLIYPLLYLYRHALELSLKDFLKNNHEKIVAKHELNILWDKIEKRLYTLASYEKQEKSLEKLKDVIDKFCAIDPNGEIPRFPEDKKGNLFLQDTGIINIIPIYKQMKEVEEIVEYFSNFGRDEYANL